MKKIICALTTAALCAAMSVTVFAEKVDTIESVTPGSNSASAEVKGTYVAGAAAKTVYSVDVAWDSMTFTYTAASAGTWNPDTHAYEGAGTAKWSDTDNTITVTNHSNVAVDATLKYTAESAYSAISGTFAAESGTAIDGKLELPTAVNTNNNAAPTATATLNLKGELSDGVNSQKIGTVTVTITEQSGNESGEAGL